MADYVSPGGAFTSGFTESIMQAAALKRQAMLDDLTKQRTLAEISQGQQRLDDERTRTRLDLQEKAKAAFTDYAAKNYGPGDVISADDIQKDKTLGTGLFTQAQVPLAGDQPPVPEPPASIRLTGPAPEATPMTRTATTSRGTVLQRTDQKKQARIEDITQQIKGLDPASPQFRELATEYEMIKNGQIPAGLLAHPPIEKPRVIVDPLAKGNPYFKIDASGARVPATAAEITGATPDRLAEARPAPADHLTRVEHKDPLTGRTIIEWIPSSQLNGRQFEKGTNTATENRLASAQAVTQVGQDIISLVSQPDVAAQLGPAMGRYNDLQEFLGSPPPEFAQLAGDIESFALANMGVHGMRSVQGADEIKKLLTAKHTPASLVSALNGLMNFSNHFLENEGRQPRLPKTPTAGMTPEQKRDYYRKLSTP